MPPDWRVFFAGDAVGLDDPTYIEAAATRWNLAVDSYLERPGDTALVRYEDFLADKAGYIARLTERLDLPLVDDITAKVDTQFHRKGTPGIVWQDFFGERNLSTIDRVCGSRMEQVGYPRLP